MAAKNTVVEFNHIGNFQVFLANFCSPKLRVYRHYGFASTYELRYIVEATPVQVDQDSRVFLKTQFCLQGNAKGLTNHLFLFLETCIVCYM